MIKALLFDMDGVLVETEKLSMGIGARYFEERGAECSSENFIHHLGMGEREFFDGANSEINLPSYSFEEATSFFKDQYLKALESESVDLPGSVEIIKSSRLLGLKVAICSSAPQWKVMANLRALKVGQDDVDAVLTANDISKNKPDPEIYIKALDALGVKPSEAIVFEDSVGGIISAVKSGCIATIVLSTLSLSDAERLDATYIIPSLKAISSKESLEEFIKGVRRGVRGAMRFGTHYVSRHRSADILSFEERLDLAERRAWRALENAYSQFSHFRVGCSVISYKTGRIYSGCNVENSSYGVTICAERNAASSAVTSEGSTGFEAVVVVSKVEPAAPPCAMCRQFLVEFCNENTLVVLVSPSGMRKAFLFSELMPYPFILE